MCSTVLTKGWSPAPPPDQKGCCLSSSSQHPWAYSKAQPRRGASHKSTVRQAASSGVWSSWQRPGYCFEMSVRTDAPKLPIKFNLESVSGVSDRFLEDPRYISRETQEVVGRV